MTLQSCLKSSSFLLQWQDVEGTLETLPCQKLVVKQLYTSGALDKTMTFVKCLRTQPGCIQTLWYSRGYTAADAQHPINATASGMFGVAGYK